MPTLPNRAHLAPRPDPSRVYVGVAAGLSAGVALAILECVAAGIQGGADDVTTGLFAWIAVLDLTLAATLGFCGGLAALAVPHGEGPAARLRAFAYSGPDSPQVRAAAVAVAMSVFLHASILLGQWVAGRFRNALLATLLYLALQIGLLIPRYLTRLRDYWENRRGS